MIFSGGFGGSDLNFSDPAVLEQFRQNVYSIVADPNRANAVTNAVVGLNEMSWQARNPNGLIETEVKNLRAVATNFNSTPDDIAAAMTSLEAEISRENAGLIQGREIIRRNTSEDEWKKLLKSLE